MLNFRLDYDLKIRTSCLKGVGPSKQIGDPYYTKKSPEDNTLIFESRFESGNLCLATKVMLQEYPLLILTDF